VFNIKHKIISKLKNRRNFLRAVAAVIYYRYPARKLKVIGVTGTDGKTTTAHLIYEILKEAELKVGLVSTIGAFYDDKEMDTGLHTTTPPAFQLQKIIAEMAKKGVKYLVLETTSHGLDQHRVLGCNFAVGVLTNVTHEHLDYHQTFEKYRQAKGKLFKKAKIAVLNKDDPSFAYFVKIAGRKKKIISYSLEKNKGADFYLKKYFVGKTQTKFSLALKTSAVNHGGSRSFRTSLPDKYNLANILAAAAATRSLNIPWRTIQKAVADFQPVAGRAQVIKCGQNFSAVVDFAHIPNALEKVLKAFTKKTKGKLIAVFGCAGERDFLKRPKMGEISARLADVSIFTAEDPRTENVNDIIGKMVEGAKPFAKEILSKALLKNPRIKKVFVREPDRQKAIGLAVSVAQKGDTILVCGKGHEKSMCFGKTEIPWSDEQAVKHALRGK
jgi:UDP-N-acetylmuramoyl-L-alanyl-D-glutamate--2,6-diaminopimelate ligase